MSPEEEDHDERENALEELEKLVGVQRTEFLLLIKTLSYILKRTSLFMIKPTKLQHELREKLKLNEDKVDAIIKLWIKNAKPIIQNLEKNQNNLNEIQDIAWKLKLQLSSQCQQKDKILLGQIQFKLQNGSTIDLEMNHDELINLYNQFENIQNELDALRSK